MEAAPEPQTLLQRRLWARPQLKVDCNRPAGLPGCQLLPRSGEPLGADAKVVAPIVPEHYTPLEILGRGAFGAVHRALCDKTGEQVALKVMSTTQEEGVLSAARWEYDVLRQISHPHIVKPIDFRVLPTQAVLVLELFDGPCLTRAVQQAPGRCFPESEARALFRALLSALEHLHSRGLVHRDVKPENVLVSRSRADLKLVDFHTACFGKDLSDLSSPGTQLYAAPEVLQGAAPTEANDMWGAGVCLHLMLSGRLPSLCGASVEAAGVGKLPELSFTGARWKGVAQPARSAVRRTLALDRAQRPTAALMLEDAWVREGANKVASPPACAEDASLHAEMMSPEVWSASTSAGGNDRGSWDDTPL